MPPWLLVFVYLLLVPSFSQTKSCEGPERNDIQDVLNDVNWKALADQLNLQDQVAAIQDICNRAIDIRPCYFREVVSRYIQSQPEESCDNTRREIAKALKERGYVNKASLLMGESPFSGILDHSDNVLNSSKVIRSGSGRPQEIRDRAAHLQDMFVTVVIHMKNFFMEMEVESTAFLKSFKTMLTTLPLSNKHKHLHFLKEEKEHINMAKDVKEIFDILEPYWDYINYAFLERIIKEFGTHELQKEMKDYMSELEEFEKKTSVKDYNSAAQDEIEIPAHFNELAITQLKDPAQYSLYDVRQLINEIINLSALTGYSVLVKSLSPSSVKIVLAFPPEAYEELLTVLDETFMKIHQLEVRPYWCPLCVITPTSYKWPKEEISQQIDTDTSDSKDFKPVMVDGITYSMVELPGSETQVVVDKRHKLLGHIHLRSLIWDLSHVEGYIKLANLGMAAAGSDHEYVKLQIEVERFGYDVTRLCEYSMSTVSSFWRESTTILINLQQMYEYLLGGFENLALEILSSVSDTAAKFAETAEELYNSFDEKVYKVEQILQKTREKEAEIAHQMKKEYQKGKERQFILQILKMDAQKIKTEKEQVWQSIIDYASKLLEANESLKTLSATVMQAAYFWKRMQEYCKALSNSKLKDTVEKEMHKHSDEQRLKLWTSMPFKKEVVIFNAGLVALGGVCDEYMGQELYSGESDTGRGQEEYSLAATFQKDHLHSM